MRRKQRATNSQASFGKTCSCRQGYSHTRMCQSVEKARNQVNFILPTMLPEMMALQHAQSNGEGVALHVWTPCERRTSQPSRGPRAAWAGSTEGLGPCTGDESSGERRVTAGCLRTW
jgi:hypothetical protein